MKSYLPFVLFLIIVAGCNQQDPGKDAETTAGGPSNIYNPYSKSEVTHEVFRVDSLDNSGARGWGYNILVDGKVRIHQPTIPAVMGNNGFTSEEKAAKAAALVVYKIKNNITPPSLTIEELDSLEVLN